MNSKMKKVIAAMIIAVGMAAATVAQENGLLPPGLNASVIGIVLKGFTALFVWRDNAPETTAIDYQTFIG